MESMGLNFTPVIGRQLLHHSSVFGPIAGIIGLCMLRHIRDIVDEINTICLFLKLILRLEKMDFSIMELWFGTVYFLYYLQLMSYLIFNLYTKGCMLVYCCIVISCFCCIMYVFCYCIVCLFLVLCLLCILLLYCIYIFCSCLLFRALLKTSLDWCSLPFKFIKSLNH